jgi:hypothetical protein
MKLASIGLTLLVGAGALVLMSGCGTDTPGVTNTLGSFSTVINGPPDKVTEAAVRAANDLRLGSVTSQESKVDGTVTARTAQNDAVNITVEQAGENVSKVSIKVGGMGDEGISTQLFDHIRTNLKQPAGSSDLPGPAKTSPGYH